MNVVVIIMLFVMALFAAMVVHELGHFLMARRAKVKVEEFGIGIPPRIFGIRRGETVYSLNAIPLGAFVRTAGENDPTVPRSLAGKGPWTRLGVYVAGPVANILLAFVLLSAFNALPYSVIAGDGIMVHAVTEDSPAQEADIRPGDVIVNVAGHPVTRWGDIQAIVNSTEQGDQVTVLLLRNGQQETTELEPRFDPQLQRRVIGVWLCWNMVTQVEEGSPAYYEAGVRPDDTILAIGRKSIYNNDSISAALRSIDEGVELKLTLLRDRKQIETSLTNAAYEALPGVELRWVPGVGINQERLPVWRAVYEGAAFVLYMPVLMVRAFPLIIRSPDLALVGPIGAGQLTVEAVYASGLSNILFMAGLISLGLGGFNLLPIPPLDGGGMIVALIEGLRRGKRLSPRSLRLAYTVGTALLIALIALVTFSDIRRLIMGGGFGL
jgi:regulator of sigma E protease